MLKLADGRPKSAGRLGKIGRLWPAPTAPATDMGVAAATA